MAQRIRVLVVEDHGGLRREIIAALASDRHELLEAGTVREARQILESEPVDTVLLDVALPDGTAFEVLDAIQLMAPRPRIVAMSGSARPEESFRLAERGVRYYLAKPLEVDQLERTMKQLAEEPPDLEPHVRNLVGYQPVREVEARIRTIMVDEALARANGSRRGAAKLLSISRQLLQYILRQRDDD